MWVAKEFNIELARAFVGWTQTRIWALELQQYNPLQRTIEEIEGRGALAQSIIGLIRRLDVGIAGLRVRSRPVDPADGNPLDVQALLNGHIRQRKGEDALEATVVETLHSVYDSNGDRVDEVQFSLLQHESSGTQKLLPLAGPLIDAIIHGRTIFLDEFDARLHPNLSRDLLALFRSPEARRSGAQLIATTHDTHLLDHRTMRRDQIWFVEKNRRGESELFSLADIKGVRNDERYEKRYLSGRYGGVPFPGDLASVIPDTGAGDAE